MAKLHWMSMNELMISSGQIIPHTAEGPQSVSTPPLTVLLVIPATQTRYPYVNVLSCDVLQFPLAYAIHTLRVDAHQSDQFTVHSAMWLTSRCWNNRIANISWFSWQRVTRFWIIVFSRVAIPPTVFHSIQSAHNKFANARTLWTKKTHKLRHFATVISYCCECECVRVCVCVVCIARIRISLANVCMRVCEYNDNHTRL